MDVGIVADSSSDVMQAIPEKIEPVVYFLQEFNTPEWHTIIRGAVAGAFLLAMIVFWHYRRKQTERG